MHQEASAIRTSLGPLVMVGYEECLAVLRDPRLGRGVDVEDPSSGMFSTDAGGRIAFLEASRHSMLLADPPVHTRLRRLVARSFTPRQVERLRPTVHELVDVLLDDLVARGDVEFMADFALPLPMAVIGELVGVPFDDRSSLQPHVRAAARGIEPLLGEEEIAGALGRHRPSRDLLRRAAGRATAPPTRRPDERARREG